MAGEARGACDDVMHECAHSGHARISTENIVADIPEASKVEWQIEVSGFKSGVPPRFSAAARPMRGHSGWVQAARAHSA